MKAKYGNFIKETAGYQIDSLDMPVSWEYIYENKDILLKVDQFGPMYAQAHPPGDVMIFKRENQQRYSPWNIWIDFNGKKFSNYFKPNTFSILEQPKSLKIQYLPECALYSFEYNGLKVTTELFVPTQGVVAVSKVTIKNISGKNIEFDAISQMIPYSNDAQMAPWDKYEWYLDSKVEKGENIVYKTAMLNAAANKENRRYTIFSLNNDDVVATELSLEKYLGRGHVYEPEFCFTNNDPQL